MKSIASRVLLGVLVVTVGGVIAGCATDKDSSLTPPGAALRGMVYNESRAPVMDMKVTWVKDGAGVQSVLSDIHGRYVFPDVPFGPVELRFEKTGYEPTSWSFSFTTASQVVYVRTANLNELLDYSADSLQKRDWSAANAYLERIKKIEPDNQIATFLQGQMLDLQGQPERAAELLETLSSDTDPSFAVELALADLYEKKLSQPDKALAHLQRALKVQDDADVRSRVDTLEKK